MQRVFTKSVGRYESGQLADYPKTTWDNIAKSVGKPLDSFSMDAAEALARTATDSKLKIKVA